MKYEKMCKLINGIIESEFNHVQMFKEANFIDTNEEQQVLYKTSVELMNKLMETLSEEQKELLDKLDGALASERTNLCRFYLREGIAAGLTNLKYLNEIDNIENYL
ncbi:hypothetical protein [uncultured Clostridium sp.]|uniref:hypothetical protein n=1 Tax=uncultured Clostridium sp. TaxID=59620 RepID=UPI0025EE3242|nr:hypothetical protein [uncultured Clostridium sp.]